MLIAGAVLLGAAVVTAALGALWLTRPPTGDPVLAVLRSVAPTQLAAAVMLAAGGLVGLAGPAGTAVLVMVVCVVGAVGTVAAGCWQGAKAVTARPPAADCAGSCATCTLSCR